MGVMHTLTASIPRATSSAEGCVVATSVDAASSRVGSCSQKIQAAVPTNAIGTQCTLRFVISTSSQTEEEFPVRDVDKTQDDASGKFSASGDGVYIVAKAGPRTCSGNTGNFCKDGKDVPFGKKLYFAPSCVQHDQQATDEEVCATRPSYVCTVCGKAFHKKCTLIVHKRVHADKSHTCGTCNKNFSDRYSLAAHERVHTGEKPFVCSICEKRFARRDYLITHSRVHSGERPYVCDICQKSFTQRSSLVTHERLHSGEGPYMCNVCQKGFALRCQLATHERCHFSEALYVCSICERRFTEKRNLVYHVRVHTGEKPYTCSVCQKGFTGKHNMIVHERLHSGI
ncbi:uncharacterized protein LOC144149479 isoform X2 [Haemaphysalis longicornis]